MSVFGDGSFTGLDDFLAGYGIVDTRERRLVILDAIFDKKTDFFPDVVLVGGKGVGMHYARLVFDPVAVRKAGGTFGADYLDCKGQRVSAVVVSGKVSGKMGEGP